MGLLEELMDSSVHLSAESFEYCDLVLFWSLLMSSIGTDAVAVGYWRGLVMVDPMLSFGSRTVSVWSIIYACVG